MQNVPQENTNMGHEKFALSGNNLTIYELQRLVDLIVANHLKNILSEVAGSVAPFQGKSDQKRMSMGLRFSQMWFGVKPESRKDYIEDRATSIGISMLKGLDNHGTSFLENRTPVLNLWMEVDAKGLIIYVALYGSNN